MLGLCSSFDVRVGFGFFVDLRVLGFECFGDF